MQRMSLNKDLRMLLQWCLMGKETQLLGDSVEKRFSFHVIASCTCYYYIMYLLKEKIRLILNISKQCMAIYQAISHESKISRERTRLVVQRKKGIQLGDWQSGVGPEIKQKGNLRAKSRIPAACSHQFICSNFRVKILPSAAHLETFVSWRIKED